MLSRVWLLGLMLLIPLKGMAAMAEGSLQRGAEFYRQYCAGCHSAAYVTPRALKSVGVEQRYIELVQHGSLPLSLADQWFGKQPPDLSLEAQQRGAKWLTGFLHGFYADSSRLFGVNNHLLPGLMMPDVLLPLREGVNRACVSTDQVSCVESAGATMSGNRLSAKEYDQAVHDLVNFLVYMSEPEIVQREALGPWVLGFLMILLLFTYALKREYWRDLR
ncbi:cytochrome c1 [Pokkaliibacter sp. CJK22405]|uniref:cytochrome c1 n=1 Tax=Pokkaliibacter sp. CJK22405 TaxID=3384615 RepID=UPI003984DA93